VPAAGSAAVPASPGCFSPATAQVALLKPQVDLMEGNGIVVGAGFIWASGSAAWLGLLTLARLITDTAWGERSGWNHAFFLSHQKACCWGPGDAREEEWGRGLADEPPGSCPCAAHRALRGELGDAGEGGLL